jgi:hypothetical protein
MGALGVLLRVGAVFCGLIQPLSSASSAQEMIFSMGIPLVHFGLRI